MGKTASSKGGGIEGDNDNSISGQGQVVCGWKVRRTTQPASFEKCRHFLVAVTTQTLPTHTLQWLRACGLCLHGHSGGGGTFQRKPAGRLRLTFRPYAAHRCVRLRGLLWDSRALLLSQIPTICMEMFRYFIQFLSGWITFIQVASVFISADEMDSREMLWGAAEVYTLLCGP